METKQIVTVVTYHEGSMHDVDWVYHSYEEALKEVERVYGGNWGKWEHHKGKELRWATYEFGDTVVIVEERRVE